MGLFDKIKKKVVGKDVFDTIKKVKKAINEKGLLKIIQLGRIPHIVPD